MSVTPAILLPAATPGQFVATDPSGKLWTVAQTGPGNLNGTPNQPFVGFGSGTDVTGAVYYFPWYGPPPVGVAASPPVLVPTPPVAPPSTIPASTYLAAGTVTGYDASTTTITQADGKGGLTTTVVAGGPWSVGTLIGTDPANNAYYASNNVYGGPVTGIQLQANAGPYVPIAVPTPATPAPPPPAIAIDPPVTPGPSSLASPSNPTPASTVPAYGTVIGTDGTGAQVYADGQGGGFEYLSVVQNEYPDLVFTPDGLDPTGLPTLSLAAITNQVNNPVPIAGLTVDANGDLVNPTTGYVYAPAGSFGVTYINGEQAVSLGASGAIVGLNSGQVVAAVTGSPAAAASPTLPTVTPTATGALPQEGAGLAPNTPIVSGGPPVAAPGLPIALPANQGPPTPQSTTGGAQSGELTSAGPGGAPTRGSGIFSSLTGSGVGVLGLVAVVGLLFYFATKG